MERNLNEKESALIGIGERDVSMFGNYRRRMIFRAIRRFLLLVVFAVAVYAFLHTDFADERGFGISDIKSFLKKEEQETLFPSYDEETETNEVESGSEADSEGETSTEIATESESENSDMPEITVTEIDISESEKGRLYYINYSDRTPDIEGIFAEGFSGAVDYYSERPVVLIIHSQTSQAYIDADEGKNAILKGVVSVGEKIAYELNKRGIPTVHCTVIHDMNDEAYKNTSSTIETMLEVYPTLKYVPSRTSVLIK
jgi:hypothetical protein